MWHEIRSFFVEFLPQEVWKLAFLYIMEIIPEIPLPAIGIISTHWSFLGWVFLFRDYASWPPRHPKNFLGPWILRGHSCHGRAHGPWRDASHKVNVRTDENWLQKIKNWKAKMQNRGSSRIWSHFVWRDNTRRTSGHFRQPKPSSSK